MIDCVSFVTHPLTRHCRLKQRQSFYYSIALCFQISTLDLRLCFPIIIEKKTVIARRLGRGETNESITLGERRIKNNTLCLLPR